MHMTCSHEICSKLEILKLFLFKIFEELRWSHATLLNDSSLIKISPSISPSKTVFHSFQLILPSSGTLYLDKWFSYFVQIVLEKVECRVNSKLKKNEKKNCATAAAKSNEHFLQQQ